MEDVIDVEALRGSDRIGARFMESEEFRGACGARGPGRFDSRLCSRFPYRAHSLRLRRVLVGPRLQYVAQAIVMQSLFLSLAFTSSPIGSPR